MPKLGKYREVAYSSDHTEHYQIEFTVNVTKYGDFTTTLDEEDVLVLLEKDVKLETNGRYGARKGYFSAPTLEKLLLKVRETLKQLYSEVLESEEIVLRYTLTSTANFAYNLDGDFIPSQAYKVGGLPDTDKGHQKGTLDIHQGNKHPTGVSMHVEALKKTTYDLGSGNKRAAYTKIDQLSEDQKETDHYYLHWIDSIICSRPANGALVHEIPYTEEAAKFFAELHERLCNMADKLAKFELPADLQRLIKEGEKPF